MIRSLSKIMTVLSLVICLAAMMGWLRSMRHRDAYRISRHGVSYAIASVGGRIVIDNEPQRIDFVRAHQKHSEIVSRSTTTDRNGVRYHTITVNTTTVQAPPRSSYKPLSSIG